MPVVLVIVFLMLALLLRSLAAPLILVTTVAASFLASLGMAAVWFRYLFHFAGVDSSVILLGFVFLVALGIDYNVFLTARARQEATTGTGPGMLRALAATGGVITSAGLVLAGTFTVLGVLPLVALTELGFLVAFGVLLDTFLVRSLMVPALVVQLGKRFWWPSRPDPGDAHAATGAA
jgi:RND superfamily putative drug exporter